MSDEKIVQTTCPYCGVGCGLNASSAEDGSITVSGDETHPANYGRMCVKGAALPETVRWEKRLLQPEVGGKTVTWDSALGAVADGFSAAIRDHGPDSVAFYVSGQLLTEDYYVANKLMKGFIASANIDSNSRLCMASTVAGHKRAFGADGVPGCYEDLERADLVIFAGSNAAWCHPVVYQRVSEAKKENPSLKVVVIDPRKTATCDSADLHLPLKPGSDATLWNGLLRELQEGGYRDKAFSRLLEEDVEAMAWAMGSAPSIEVVAKKCDLHQEAVRAFYDLFAKTEKVVTLFSQGINQSSSGTDKVNAILNSHLLTGRIGKPGMGPFSLTGQPNAMGGREVGALANQLAAHMEIHNAKHRKVVEQFWQCSPLPKKPGLTAVDMFQAMADGKIKAVWIMGSNPAVSLPNSTIVQKALKKCPMVVVSDVVQQTDTNRYAHILLPALDWGEKSGTVTNSERRISRQRSFLPAPGQAKADWWIISQVAKRMGYESAFSFSSSWDVFSEHAALSGYQNNGDRLFNIQALSSLGESGYETLKPIQWPVVDHGVGTKRLYSGSMFHTKNGKARIIPIIPAEPRGTFKKEYALLLNTGRTRDQWHTMTRTGFSPRLGKHKPEPYVEIHPDDGNTYEVKAGDFVQLESRLGTGIFKAVISNSQRPGELFVPMHWSREFSSQGIVNALVHPFLDPHSKQPEFKQTPVRLRSLNPAWVGVAYCRGDIVLDGLLYSNRVAMGNSVWRYDLAGQNTFSQWPSVARGLFSKTGDSAWLEYIDTGSFVYRGAFMDGERVGGCLFMAKRAPTCNSGAINTLFSQEITSNQDRGTILSGGCSSTTQGEGITICACFGVSREKIMTVLAGGQAATVEAVGQRLKAGTNCGSCIPEIRSIIAENRFSV